MSLLLDALKKSGEYQQKGTGLSNLTLEDAPASRTASSSSTSSTNASNRTAGEAMFAAKKKKSSSGFRWNLGLVPTTLLIALVFGSADTAITSGWKYNRPARRLWYSALRRRPHVAPTVAAAPPLVPFIPPQEKSEPVPPVQPLVTARNEDFDAPRNKPKTGKPRSRTASARVDFQRKVTTDTITPALLDAYQAYQRGDYVTADARLSPCTGHGCTQSRCAARPGGDCPTTRTGRNRTALLSSVAGAGPARSGCAVRDDGSSPPMPATRKAVSNCCCLNIRVPAPLISRWATISPNCQAGAMRSSTTSTRTRWSHPIPSSPSIWQSAWIIWDSANSQPSTTSKLYNSTFPAIPDSTTHKRNNV